MSKTENRTVAARLHEAFLNLVNRQSFDSISICGLCQEAGISRTTFYKYYDNIMEVAQDIVEGIINSNAMIDLDESGEEDSGTGGVPLCEFVRQHPEYQALFFEPALSNFIVHEIAEKRWLQYVEHHIGTPDRRIKQLFYYQGHGCLAMMQHVRGMDEAEWKKRRETVDAFVRSGMKAVLK